MKATAVANSNIALVKYWGKRNSELILPYNSSVSMTLESLNTKTTVEFDEQYQDFEVILNGKLSEGEEKTDSAPEEKSETPGKPDSSE